MAKNTNDNDLSKKLEKEKEIKQEINRINGFLKEIEPKVKKGVKSLIDNVAYMAVTLRELRGDINQEGLITEYQNGMYYQS